MNKATCCTIAGTTARSSATKAADGEAHPPSGKRSGFTLAKCSVPTVILALLPKCPACFAAYVALGTGISVSVAAASVLRALLTGICMAMLVWAVASAFRSMPLNRLRPHSRLH